MPFEWEQEYGEAPVNPGASSFSADGPPLAVLHLWPYRSLPRRGFAGILGLAFLLLMIPLFPLIGSALLWGLLPFALGALWALWYFLEKSYRDGEILEELTIWSDRIRLVRSAPSAGHQEWQANTYWAAVNMHKTGGPVPVDVTLKGDGREVEIGAFLSEEERLRLYDELQRALAKAKSRS
jgi:uncharacterized membrane protein